MRLCHKFWFSNPYIFETQCRKSLIFHTYIIWTDRSHSLQCQRSTILGSKDIGIRKSKFVAKTQFLFADFSVDRFWLERFSHDKYKNLSLSTYQDTLYGICWVKVKINEGKDSNFNIWKFVDDIQYLPPHFLRAWNSKINRMQAFIVYLYTA